jgi:phosphopantothenoylcysteine decarboxylase/phosphopantothenate--cysteine ligase
MQLSRIQTDQVLAGFALETTSQRRNALDKLKKKKLDVIVANSPQTFNSDKISSEVMLADGRILSWGSMTKSAMADKLIRLTEKLFDDKQMRRKSK